MPTPYSSMYLRPSILYPLGCVHDTYTLDEYAAFIRNLLFIKGSVVILSISVLVISAGLVVWGYGYCGIYICYEV